ncbi:MAG: heavy metal translocating P-type ATPase [Candidatus Faecousia sp.]|uniref:heavy metal translocating P-type ATPase n=1 Tax=Faecousia sp. TaxID=2952921 RepID=UPI002A86EA49|nr:heavy metal translocating P-type ATPase [Candidatus Faecousia sp.]
MKQQFDVTGMSCAACSARVEKAVKAVAGVERCAVSLLTNSMAVEGDAPAEAIVEAVTAAGYGASPKGAEKKPVSPKKTEKSEVKTLLTRLICSLALLLPLMYLTMGHGMWGWPVPKALAENAMAQGLTQLLLTTAVLVINQKFFKSGVRGLLHRAPNMDTLVSLGAAAAYGYSLAVLYRLTAMPEHMHMLHELYFESAAMILTLITLGKLLEARAKGKTTDALQSLLALSPKTATVVRDGKELSIPVEQVRTGDVFLVRPAQSIPVDGVVLEGSSAVNEAALTGESLPVDKAEGDTVSAATMNKSGFLKCRATRVGEDTTLSQIIKLMSDAAATKAPIAKLADRVSGVFVPVVMSIAAVTLIVWLLVGQSFGYALARGISVLVISCPCALGLATPVAIMVGSGMGAKRGILFKTAVSLETTGKVHTVVMDKTGTVTEGKPRVTDLLPAEGVTEERLLSTAFALEARSEHPLARAVVERAGEQTPAAVTDFAAAAGNGLSARLDGVELRGGKRAYMTAAVPQAWEERALALAQEGKTPLYFSEGGRFLGLIAVADTLKPDTVDAVRELKRLGLHLVLLTGDNRRTAEAIARQAGIDEVVADVLPDGKEAVVRELQKNGRVCMVGDGVNDAPALTRADVGLAIGAGTDVAIDAADVVLMNSRLSDVATAVRLSRATLRNIRENLFWAFFYNCLGIPLAAGAFVSLLGWELNPMFGAAAMSLSSFCVVTNALRLNFFGDKKSKKHHNKEQKTMKKTMKIEGMMCGHCEAAVKRALEAIPQVESAEVSHVSGTAVVTLREPVADDVLRAAVEAKDYRVTSVD